MMRHFTLPTRKSRPFVSALAIALSVAACGGGGDGGRTVTEPASGGENPAPPAPPAPSPTPPAESIPVNAQYEITVVGFTAPGGVVSQVADLVVAPAVTPAAGGPVNGANPLEVGIITHASPTSGSPGALWFGTNTALASNTGSNAPASAVDVAYVDAKQAAATVDITVDGKAIGVSGARRSKLNVYSVQLAGDVQAHNILSGLVNVRFTNGGQNVSGEINLAGFGGFALSSSYQATFTGIRVK